MFDFVPHRPIPGLAGSYDELCPRNCPAGESLTKPPVEGAIGETACAECPGVFLTQNVEGAVVATCPVTKVTSSF